MKLFSEHSMGTSIRHKINRLVKDRKEVKSAEPLTSFEYFVTDIHSAENASFSEKEPHAHLLFTFNAELYFALLKSLQSLGFDIFAMLSNPKKGELASPMHGDIPFLRSRLQATTEKQNIFPNEFVRNKLRLRGYLKEGRLHLRFYTGIAPNAIFITAHIDPPDLRNHANILNHLRKKVKTDYQQGEDLFIDVLKHLGGTRAENELNISSPTET